MTERPNILIVCARNKKRSRTAEYIFKNDDRFNVRSAGLSPKSNRKLTENDLHWADAILVMEKVHRSQLRDMYNHMDLPYIEVLDVEDEYEFMDEELVQILTDKMNDFLKSQYDL